MEDEVREKVIKVLRTIYDPEIPVNIYELGLIYRIDLHRKEDKLVCEIEMTLTSPACPVAESLLDQVNAIRYIVEEIDELNVNVVFDPPWSPDKISYEGKLELGLL
jgi:metal-sulfur cluster biosynthetic enzyme